MHFYSCTGATRFRGSPPHRGHSMASIIVAFVIGLFIGGQSDFSRPHSCRRGIQQTRTFERCAGNKHEFQIVVEHDEGFYTFPVVVLAA